jgi:hypothetical protein
MPRSVKLRRREEEKGKQGRAGRQAGSRGQAMKG